jgi:hypothetical protein
MKTMSQQLRKHQDFFLKMILLGGFLLSLLMSCPAKAETNPFGFSFSQTGTAFIPLPLLQALRQNSISPVMQYAVLNSLLNQSIQDALSQGPAARDPFVVAQQKYCWGISNLTQTFQTALITSLLPQFSSDPSAQAQAQALASALAQGQSVNVPGCGSGEAPLDPNLLALVGYPH